MGAGQSSGMGPSGTTNTLSVSGLNYGITWKTISANFTVPSTQINALPGVTCSAPPARTGSFITVSQITLPNGQSYHFYYGADNPHSGYSNPYGLLSEIDYPDGGWVRYTWKLSDTTNELADYPGMNDVGTSVPNGCLYEYKTPVVATRQVSFGSSGPALTQAFSYSTTWSPTPSNPGNWSEKDTTVCTTDNVRGSSVCSLPSSVPANAFLTKYTYGSISVSVNNMFINGAIEPQIPMENTVSDYDWGNTTAPSRTVSKTWNNQYQLASQTTVIGVLSKAVHYTYGAFSEPVETDEYDWGATTL